MKSCENTDKRIISNNSQQYLSLKKYQPPNIFTIKKT
ncbi:Uncharacterised protein [Porphyromonas cangingivalis]|nr:Uncharacterised protein [Porphyromonas cangingivalis]